jgi:hypothetical protein
LILLLWLQVGRGALGHAKEFKALQALTEQLNAAQQRTEESGKTEAAAARAAIQALAESVNKRLGYGERVEQPACSKQSLVLPCSAAANHGGMMLGEFNTAGQEMTCDELDKSALLAACTAWLPPAACPNNQGAPQPVPEQQATHLSLERFSTWIPAAVESSAQAAEVNGHMDVAALLASSSSASSWLPPISCDGLDTQERVSAWLPHELLPASSAMLKAGDRVSAWLPPTASSAASAATRKDRLMDVTAFLASPSSWLPPASNENVPSVEVRLADAPG